MFCLAIQTDKRATPEIIRPYLWSSNNDRSLDTHAGWLSMALPILLRASVFNRLRTSCSASVPAASLPIHSVARARWLVSSTDTWRARPECSNSSIWLPVKKIFHVSWWMWFFNIHVHVTMHAKSSKLETLYWFKIVLFPFLTGLKTPQNLRNHKLSLTFLKWTRIGQLGCWRYFFLNTYHLLSPTWHSD